MAKKKQEIEAPDLSYLETWANNKKISYTAEQLEVKFYEIAKAMQEAKPDLGNEEIWTKARQRLYNELKSETKSSRAPWKIRIDWKSKPFDYGNKHYQANYDLAMKNYAYAAKGLYARKQKDKTGKTHVIVPLDERDLTSSGKKNKNKGKPLPEHAWIQSIGGLGMFGSKYESGEWEFLKPVTITVSGNMADPTHQNYLADKIQNGVWYDADLSNKTDKENTESWELNVSPQSTFKIDNAGIEMDIESLPGYYEIYYNAFDQIEAYHQLYAEPGKTKEGAVDDNKTKSRRIVMTYGMVSDIIISEEEGGNTRIVLDKVLADDDLGFGEDDVDSISCWYDGDREIPFGKFSTIFVWGETSQQRMKDLATEEYLEEWGTPSITIHGIVVVDLEEPSNVIDEIGGDAVEDIETDGEVTVENTGEVPDIENIEEEPVEEATTEESEAEPEEETESESEEEEIDETW